MKNYILFSAPRTGSTYFGAAIATQLTTLEPSTFDGGEYFRWTEYLQIGPPSASAPGNLSQLEADPLKYEKFESKKPSGESPQVFMGTGGIIEREPTETTWGDRGEVCYRRAWLESQRRLTLLENSYFPWVVKVHPETLLCMDMRRFNQLVERDSTSAVILYRGNLWEWFLSWAALRKTGIFQQRQIGGEGDWEKPEIKAQKLPDSFLQRWYVNAREFLNMVLSYRGFADHVVRYEDLTQNPAIDAGFVTGIGLYPKAAQHVKLWSTEEKEKMIANLDDVKRIHEAYCKVLGFPDGNMVI